MKYPRHLKPFTGQLDVSPFAGVFFLLVLLLVMDSNLAPPPGLTIQLPVAVTPASSLTAHPAVVVAMDRDERLFFDHQIIAEAALGKELAQRVHAAGERLSLVLEADAAVRLSALTRVEELAKKAGIAEVRLATRPPLFGAPHAGPGGP